LSAWIDYPFQRHFQKLPQEHIVRDSATRLEAAGRPGTAAHFGEQVIEKFGRGVAEHFLTPYNRRAGRRTGQGRREDGAA
jgi:hypothetical protein